MLFYVVKVFVILAFVLKVNKHSSILWFQGASKNLNLMEWDKLWTINKKIIDLCVPDILLLLKKNVC